MCAQRPHVSTMTLQGPLGTSLASRSTTQESMVRRNGSVISAPRDMLFNLIGKPTPRFVALENIDVIVEPFSLGGTASSHTGPFVMP